MDPNRDSRYNLNYSMSMMSETPEIYGNPNVTLARPPSGLGQQIMGGRGGGGGLMSGTNNNAQCVGLQRGIKRTNSDCYDDRVMVGQQQQQQQQQQNLTGLDGCNVQDVVDDGYTQLQPKKSPPTNGKKTKGRVKIKMEYIDNKLRRYTTFSKRKTGIMKKAYELSTLTGTQVMLLVASETGHVYTFATRKLQPMITSEAGKALIQTCLNSPDPPNGSTGDQRMSATGFEETELSYNIGDEDSKDDRSPVSSGGESDDSSGPDSPGPPLISNNLLNSNNLANIGLNNSNHNSVNITQSIPISASTIIHQQQQQHQLHQQQQQALIDSGNIQHHVTISSPLTSSSSSSSSSSSVPVVAQTTVTPIAANKMSSLSSSLSSSTSVPATTTITTNNIINSNLNMNRILYPASALSNLPQDVLVSLLQSGQLQLHTNEDGAHQYIAIPLSMTSASPNKLTTSSSSPPIRANDKSGGKMSSSKDIKIKTELID